MKRYETPQALRRALEDRLLAQARREGGDIQRLRRQTAFDRLLCRLFHEANPPWLLKGGYAMELRIRAARTTRDIDLAIRQLPGGMKPRFGACWKLRHALNSKTVLSSPSVSQRWIWTRPLMAGHATRSMR